MLGSIVPRTYYNSLAAGPFPTIAIPSLGVAAGELFSCSYTGRVWIGSDNTNALYQPLALQWQWTSANAGTTLANIRRINSGVTADAVAGFEHTGAIVFSDILSAPMLGTDATGRVVSVAGASATSVLITARNNTLSQINKGQAVRISGALGQNPTISLAQANAYATTDAIGLAAANIGSNSTGSVIIAGTLTNLDTSAFNNGDTLYLSATTAGALQNTDPLRPNWQMQMGYVEHAHPTQGKILVHANLESTKTEYITDMTQAGVALATLAPLNEGVLLGRLSGIGNPEPVAIGYGMAMLGDLGVSLASASNALSADVVMTNAGTWYDGPSISLPAGTWMIDSCVTVQKGAVSGVGDLSARITNGTTHYASSEATWNTRSASMTSISLSTRITLASTTTIKVQAVSTFAASAIKAATIYQASGNNASNINAVRVA
jgi:hypothetical protein